MYRLQLSTMVVLLAFTGYCHVALAQLAGYGPLDSVNGFPRWFEDANGVRVTIGLDGDGVNGLSVFDPVDPNNPFSVRIGFGDEAFYWTADARLTFGNGDRADLVLAMEAAFDGDGSPSDGDQLAFGRFRVRFDVPVAGTYTVIHPYGTQVFENLAAGERFVYTHDRGGFTPYFERALNSRIQPTFLTAADPPPPPGYLGDPQILQTVTGSPTGNNFFRLIGPEGADLDGQGNNFLETNLFNVSGKIATIVEWASATGGNWSDAVNWTGPVPNGIAQEAMFLGNLQVAGTVNLDVPVTVGYLMFDNTNSYTLAGANSLTMQAGAGASTIRVARGAHRIGVPLILAGNTVVYGAGGLSTGPVNNSGILTVRANVSAGDVTGTGSMVAGDGVTPVTISANQIRQTALTINAGATVVINANGTNSGTSRVQSLTVAGVASPAGRLDLNDSQLVVQTTPAEHGVMLLRLSNLIKSGLENGGAFDWRGMGIMSTAAANRADGATAIGILDNNDGAGGSIYTEFGGMAVDGNSILVSYTWVGDTDLDRALALDDFVSLLTGMSGGPQSWRTGDFDYSGAVTVDDYFAFLNAMAIYNGGGTLSPIVGQQMLDAVTANESLSPEVSRLLVASIRAAVPESGTLALVGLASGWLALRRRPGQR